MKCVCILVGISPKFCSTSRAYGDETRHDKFLWDVKQQYMRLYWQLNLTGATCRKQISWFRMQSIWDHKVYKICTWEYYNEHLITMPIGWLRSTIFIWSFSKCNLIFFYHCHSSKWFLELRFFFLSCSFNIFSELFLHLAMKGFFLPCHLTGFTVLWFFLPCRLGTWS